jgi:hypothetical protein
MIKSINTKFARSLFLLISFALFCCLSGCGAGGEDAEDRGIQISTFTVSKSSMASGQYSILTVKVLDGSGNPVKEQTVTFSFLYNNSGANITTLNNGSTDVNGQAVAVYTAGADSSDYELEDAVQASVTGSAKSAILTRTAGTVLPSSGYNMTLTATPSSLVAGGISVIIATVTDTAGNPSQGQTVTFTVPINNSAGTLADDIVTTDAAGKAITTYTPGNDSPSGSVPDVISASVNGSAYSVTITRLPAVGTGNRIVSFTEDPETGLGTPLGPPWEDVIMKVTVTEDDLVSPVVGETVTFTIVDGAGILTNPDEGTTGSPITAITDTNGEAWILFTRPDTGTDDTVVRAQIPGTTNGGDAARIVYWTDVAP